MSGFEISRLVDHALIRSFLNQDTDYAAYALGDLDPPYAEHAVWFAARESGEIKALALNYRGLDPQALFVMGDATGVRELLAAGIGTSRVYYAAKAEQEVLLAEFYELHEVQNMYRMRVTHDAFRPSNSDTVPAHSIANLNSKHVEDILALQHRAALVDNRAIHDIAFAPNMVNDGYYCGVVDQDGCLIAVAGTHIVARKSKIAAVGNVVTDPQHRRRGLATQVSAAVTASLIRDGYNLIVLNVKQDNLPAIATYKKLGYEITGKFIEGLAERHDH